MKISKKNLKKGMTAIFDGILGSMSTKAKADPLFAYLSSKKEWLGDPEDMNVMIFHDLNNIINEVVKKTLGVNDHIICNIYTDWNLFDLHVTELCSRLYGPACCADRGRFIVKSFIKYRITKKLPVFNPKPENYHHPETGTPKQWMAFVESIDDLKYGDPRRYLVAYKDLIMPDKKSRHKIKNANRKKGGAVHG
ncbi:MAG: hypothetical protein WC976_06705 [Caldisericia bacterium]